MPLIANGTTFSFGTLTAPVRRITASDDGNPIDITGLAQTATLYEAGVGNLELTVEILGSGAGVSRGDKGQASVSFTDGGTFSISNALLSRKEVEASSGNAITCTLTFVPTTGT